MLLGDTGRLEHVGVQLLQGLSSIHDQHRQHEHALILALQLLQERFGVLAVGGQVRGNDVHVVAGTDCLFLLFDLGPVKLRDRMLDGLDRFRLIHGLDVHRDDLRGIHVQEILQKLVRKVRCRDLQIAHGTEEASHLEGTAAGEGKGRRGNKVLYGKAGLRQPLPVKTELILRISHVKHVVHEFQPLVTVQDVGPDTQLLEVVQKIVLDMLKPRFCLFHGVSLDSEGQELGLGKAVVALGQLVLQHLRILVTDAVERILPVRDPDSGLKALRVGRHVHETELEMDGAVEKVQEPAPLLKDRSLVFLLGQLIVDVLKPDGLGIKASDTTDAVGEHPVKGNRLLGGPGDPIVFLCAVNDFLDPFLVRSGQSRGKLQ